MTYVNTQTTIQLNVANLSINAVSNYTWFLNFSTIATRDPIVLIFPIEINLSNALVYYGTTLITTTIIGASKLNMSGILSLGIGSNGTATLVVTGVINPPSAILTKNYYLTTQIE